MLLRRGGGGVAAGCNGLALARGGRAGAKLTGSADRAEVGAGAKLMGWLGGVAGLGAGRLPPRPPTRICVMPTPQVVRMGLKPAAGSSSRLEGCDIQVSGALANRVNSS